MANPDFVPGAFFKSAQVPKVVQRHQKKKAQEKALADAYAIVDKRDGNRCRVTGEPLSPSSVDPKHRREHHHLIPRSRSKELREDPDNIVLVSKLAHDLITNGWIDVEGTDATKAVRFFWAAFVKPEQRIFRIKSRRKSQNRE